MSFTSAYSNLVGDVADNGLGLGSIGLNTYTNGFGGPRVNRFSSSNSPNPNFNISNSNINVGGGFNSGAFRSIPNNSVSSRAFSGPISANQFATGNDMTGYSGPIFNPLTSGSYVNSLNPSRFWDYRSPYSYNLYSASYEYPYGYVNAYPYGYGFPYLGCRTPNFRYGEYPYQYSSYPIVQPECLPYVNCLNLKNPVDRAACVAAQGGSGHCARQVALTAV